ncbi:MAG: hypothetical protein II854_05145 [Prevotella sp.]|nr:hypothetical protein [Prevotella sp.]
MAKLRKTSAIDAKELAFLRRLPSESNFGEAKAKQNECNVKQNGSLFYACPNEKIPSAAMFLARGDALLCAFRDSGAIS